ncbi:flavodoxin [Acholeplasma sp. OttesenSCG-928-E16]|nr:flavodoxin [Acholeplasma sp. OttesenSCG-928-E16]
MSKILVVYWSGTGNTEAMAEKIKEGIEAAGAEVDLKTVSEVDPSDCDAYDKVAFGCPSMGVEVLEEDEFEPFFADVEGSLAGKKIALFGSYGWGDGQWMVDWEDRVRECGAILFLDKGLIVNSTPEGDDEELCVDFGKTFAAF